METRVVIRELQGRDPSDGAELDLMRRLRTRSKATMNLTDTYDQAFYDSQMDESLQAARIFIAHLRNFVQPESVIDVGCGRGMWLKACHELGSTELYGYDGPWNRQELMADSSVVFKAIDLDRAFTAEHVDLAISLEVAEHLAPSSASLFVASLASTSDIVLFGAAYPGQGGTHHINEQRASYWAALFHGQGFDAFDLFRPALWGDTRVPYWYRQNTFAYLRRGSVTYEKALRNGVAPVSPAFMDCVHPDMFALSLRARKDAERNLGFFMHVKSLVPSFLRAVRRRFAK